MRARATIASALIIHSKSQGLPNDHVPKGFRLSQAVVRVVASRPRAICRG